MLHLNKLTAIPMMCRQVYFGYKFDNKPNDHCVWQNVSVTTNIHMAWVETDEHFRKRIKERF